MLRKKGFFNEKIQNASHAPLYIAHPQGPLEFGN